MSVVPQPKMRQAEIPNTTFVETDTAASKTSNYIYNVELVSLAVRGNDQGLGTVAENDPKFSVAR